MRGLSASSGYMARLNAASYSRSSGLAQMRRGLRFRTKTAIREWDCRRWMQQPDTGIANRLDRKRRQDSKRNSAAHLSDTLGGQPMTGLAVRRSLERDPHGLGAVRVHLFLLILCGLEIHLRECSFLTDQAEERCK